jgi:hypothetical protein
MAVVPLLGYQKFWKYKCKTLKLEYQELVGKHPDAEAQLRQLFRVFCDIEDVAGYAPASVGESDKWTAIVNTVEENCVNYCKAFSGKTLYSTLYGMYTVTLKELKGLVKASIFAEESSNTDVTEEQPDEEEGFQEVRRHKRHSTDETAKTAKKVAVQAKTSPTLSSEAQETEPELSRKAWRISNL